MTIKQSALVIDIETSPILGYFWELGTQYVGTDQIVKDWHIMSWAAKWEGDPDSKIIYRDVRNSKGDDKPILKELWKLLDQADIVITQNGKKFDSRKINARFMIHRMPPPKPYTHIDTYRLVKQVAAHTSNKLEYLTNRLNSKHKKTAHRKYPGRSLWTECLKGNIEAWNEMKHYNIDDVLATEELYSNIKAWTTESMPKMYVLTDRSDTCSTCGYIGPMRKGKDRVRKSGVYTQNSCVKCGAWQVAKQKISIKK